MALGTIACIVGALIVNSGDTLAQRCEDLTRPVATPAPPDPGAPDAARREMVAQAREAAWRARYPRADILRFEFFRTEMQQVGDIVIVHSSYLIELRDTTRRWREAGSAMEVFARSGGRWVAVGWHLAPDRNR